MSDSTYLHLDIWSYMYFLPQTRATSCQSEATWARVLSRNIGSKLTLSPCCCCCCWEYHDEHWTIWLTMNWVYWSGKKLCCWICFCWPTTILVNQSLLFLLLLSLTNILSCKHIVVVSAFIAIVNHLFLAAPKCLESLRESAILVAFRWLLS